MRVTLSRSPTASVAQHNTHTQCRHTQNSAVSTECACKVARCVCKDSTSSALHHECDASRKLSLVKMLCMSCITCYTLHRCTAATTRHSICAIKCKTQFSCDSADTFTLHCDNCYNSVTELYSCDAALTLHAAFAVIDKFTLSSEYRRKNSNL
jgi:hypothetical protein